MKKKAKETTKSGVDRWTSNGIGIKNFKPAISKSEAAKINAEATSKGKK